jgi:hypothetical protein
VGAVHEGGKRDYAREPTGSLRERQLTVSNSATLHELYFENLCGDGKVAGEVVKALGGAYGSARAEGGRGGPGLTRTNRRRRSRCGRSRASGTRVVRAGVMRRAATVDERR